MKVNEMVNPTDPQNKWHAMEIGETIEKLRTSRDGLQLEEAKRRLIEFGANELIEKKKISPLKIFVSQFKNFLILILLGAVAVSAVIGETIDAIVIFAIVIACAVLGFSQEYRAERLMEALKRMAAVKARVIRGGEEIEVPTRELVPGDIIVLKAGDRISADSRLIEALNLKTEEASLTGESAPVEKQTKSIRKDATIGDRNNLVFMGTNATYGRGKAVVVATGMSTEFGKIAEMVQEAEEPRTPLERRLEKMGKVLVWVLIIVCAIVSVVGTARGQPPKDMFILGVALAVAAVPEALPAVVTVALAIGTQRMAKRNAIVRKLPAVETLGCTTVICSDKTGTLTRNEMTVRRLFVNDRTIVVTGEGYEPKGEFYIKSSNDKHVISDPQKDADIALLLRISTLCNDARLKTTNGNWIVEGDPTEEALTVAAAKARIMQEKLNEQYPRVGEFPFTSERKLMSTIHNTPDGKKVAYVKGAPEMILEKCAFVLKNGKKKGLSQTEKGRILETNQKMASEALRVLGMAYKELPDTKGGPSQKDVERDLIFVGLIGMIDAPREEVIDAIKKCKRAGIKVIMITGDNKNTALAVGKELGLDGGRTLTGAEIDGISDEELEKIVEDVSIYARVSPEHKTRIVKSLKRRGHIVAMTGDGVNDAPALKNSDIGVAMGITGTDVAKEASDIVLVDDNFATIVAAVEEGRGIYDNIKKYLAYLLSCNIAEILIIFTAVGIIGLPLPLVAVQLLWVNLVTDGLPALALGVDPSDPDIMDRPPRNPNESVFTRSVKTLIVGVAAIILLGTLPLFYWAYGGDKLNLIKAQTMAFTVLIMFEMFNAFNCRSEKHSVFKVGPFSNRFLVAAVISSVLMQLIVVHVHFFNVILDTVPLGLLDWALILAISFTVLIAVEIGKKEKGLIARFQRKKAKEGRKIGVNGLKLPIKRN
jgi:Ca2+-transporting ATPase